MGDALHPLSSDPRDGHARVDGPLVRAAARAGKLRGVHRYLHDRPLPPYAFLPGVDPHPTRAPGGHSHGRGPEPLDTAFVWGVDLYNHGYLWEAHEAWEPLWLGAPAGSGDIEFFKGLIQCAAACLKIRGQQADAARRLGARALGHLEHAIDRRADTRGLDLPAFTGRFAAWIGGEPQDVDMRPRIELEG